MATIKYNKVRGRAVAVTLINVVLVLVAVTLINVGLVLVAVALINVGLVLVVILLYIQLVTPVRSPC